MMVNPDMTLINLTRQELSREQWSKQKQTFKKNLPCSADVVCLQRVAYAPVAVRHQLSPPADSPTARQPIAMDFVLRGMLSSIHSPSSKDKMSH